MTKVIQVRGVPDDVHAALVEAAQGAGVSLNAYVLDRLIRVVEEIDPVSHDERVLADLRAEVGAADVDRETVLDIIHRGREERAQQLIGRYLREGA